MAMQASSNRYQWFRLAFWGVLLALLLLGAGVLWLFAPVHHPAVATSRITFIVVEPFEEVRQALLGRNAAPAMAAYPGMKLVNDQLDDVVVDPTPDQQPVLKSLLGESTADIQAERQLIVATLLPTLDADQVTLMQRVELDGGEFTVTTRLRQPTGNLQDYTSRLVVEELDNGDTRVMISLEYTVRIEVTRAWIGVVNQQVQQAAQQAVLESRRSLGFQPGDMKLNMKAKLLGATLVIDW